MTSRLHRLRRAPHVAVRGISLSLLVVPLVGVASSLVLWALARRPFADPLTPDRAALSAGLLVTVVVTGVVGVQRRIGRNTTAHLRRMEHRASHDELTGLLNREELFDRLDQALESAYRHGHTVGVLFCDLDGFKAINDSMGHEAGDELLRQFAARLRRTVRRGDVVGRVGGDEFVVVAPDMDHDWTAREIADNIRAAFQAPIKIVDGSAMMVPSIGVSVASRSNPATAEEVVAHADQMMYRAKRTGSGVEVFDDDNRREVLDRREVERAIVPALADGQFQVHYQPIVSESERRIVGLEGLIRWQHPIHGVIGPDRFLPVAEEAGLVARLGEVVLREVAAQASVWNHLFGIVGGPSVAVNLAERQLLDASFPDRLAEIIEWAGIPASQLDLEIREQLLHARAGDKSNVLPRLAQLGCRIVVDDFGVSETGYSRARRFDLIDVVKIDRSIIAAIEHDDVSRAVVDATVSMASALDLDIVAEGVERSVATRSAARHGCRPDAGIPLPAPVTSGDVRPLRRGRDRSRSLRAAGLIPAANGDPGRCQATVTSAMAVSRPSAASRSRTSNSAGAPGRRAAASATIGPAPTCSR